jgi:hypothetical protein
MPTLTYREAAALTGRAINTIRHWRRNGMVMGWEQREGQQVRVVELHVLQAYYRERLQNWPTHQYRMRALQAAQGDAHGPTRRVSPPPPPGVLDTPNFKVVQVSDRDTNGEGPG